MSTPPRRDWRTAKRKRQSGLTIRLSEAERATINEQAACARMTPGAYVRKVLLDAPPPRQSIRRSNPEAIAALASLLAELGREGNNLNQLTRLAHSGKAMPQALEDSLTQLTTTYLSVRQQLAKL